MCNKCLNIVLHLRSNIFLIFNQIYVNVNDCELGSITENTRFWSNSLKLVLSQVHRNRDPLTHGNAQYSVFKCEYVRKKISVVITCKNTESLSLSIVKYMSPSLLIMLSNNYSKAYVSLSINISFFRLMLKSF